MYNDGKNATSKVNPNFLKNQLYVRYFLSGSNLQEKQKEV